MSRTQKRWDCDQGYSDGGVDLAATDFFSVGTDAPTLTRNAKGDISLHWGNSKSAIIVCPLSKLLFRTGLLDDLQEQFGTGGNQPGLSATNAFGTGTGITGARGQSAGYPYTKTTGTITKSAAAVSMAVVNSADFAVSQFVLIDGGSSTLAEIQQISAIADATHITVRMLKNTHTGAGITVAANPFTTPAGVSGTPPYTGVSELVPVTAPRPKGISFVDMSMRYLNGSADMTTLNVGLSKTVYANATALAITDILAAGANGLVKTTAATPYSTRIALTNGYQVTDNAEFWIEVTAATAGGGTFDFYGADFHVMYNFN